MKRNGQIRVLLGIMFLGAWAVAAAFAQYDCLPANVCQQADTSCPDTCGTACGVNFVHYLGTAVNVLQRTGGPCQDANLVNPDPDCKVQGTCAQKPNDGLTCGFNSRNGNLYCGGVKTAGKTCPSCSNPSPMPNPSTVQSYTCSKCGG